jgi:ribose transport system permease protein
MLTLAFFEVAHPSVGVGTELFVIASAIIGGTALTGGTGSVVGAAIGAVIISVIRSGLVQFGVTANWSTVATGAVIIGAVALDTLVRRRRALRARRLAAPTIEEGGAVDQA